MPIEVEIKKQSLNALITSHRRPCALLPRAVIMNTVVISDTLFFLQGFTFTLCDQHLQKVVCFKVVQFKKEAAFLAAVCLSLLQLRSLPVGWWLSHARRQKQQQICFSDKQHLQTGMNPLMVTCWIWGLQVRMAH